MNLHSLRAIYAAEMASYWQFPLGAIASPVISTSLYFLVFGSALGTGLASMGGVSYGAFIVPGLLALTVITSAMSNGAIGIFWARYCGTIFEVLSARVSATEALLGYVGAATTHSLILGSIILASARLFVSFTIIHPLRLAGILLLTCVTFSCVGFVMGLWSERSMQRLQLLPTLIVTPLIFLGGTFYSLDVLPPLWRRLTLLNPVVYLISGFRWSLYGVSELDPTISVCAVLISTVLSIMTMTYLFRRGYKLKS